MSTCVLNHPLLGQIRGVARESPVVQYLGLQYATLKDRFARGVLVDARVHSGGILDATRFGPTPLIPENACEIEHRLFQKSIPAPKLEMSDTECLTLNITAPAETQSANLPVLVFVHGGGFTTGSSNFPHYDLSRFVAMSIKDHKTPIVGVAINYRVGAPGFLTSPIMRKAGYLPNNGLHDQRLALQWIQRNVAGFGGDPAKVTFLGQSAGAASGFFHLHQTEPLFQSFVAMSGTSLLRPRSQDLLETAFVKIAETLGAVDQPPEEQLKVLQTAPADVFARAVGRRFNLGPMVDGSLIPTMTSYEILSSTDQTKKLFPGLRRCSTVLIGDCEMDGMIWGLRIASRNDVFPQTLATTLSHSLDNLDRSLTNWIFDSYRINPVTTTNSQETTRPVLDLGHDLTFMLPVFHFADAFSRCGCKVFRYHFNCPMPWQGPWRGVAIHGQDLVWALQNYREHLEADQQEAATLLASHLIAFAQQDKPYEDSAHGAMVYDVDSGNLSNTSRFIRMSYEAETKRRRDLFDHIEPIILDKLLDGWHGFMST